MKRRKICGLLLYSLSALSLNATTIDQGSASSYPVLAGSTVTNTGAPVFGGNLGVSKATAVTGFPAGIVYRTQHLGEAGALAAQKDAVAAFGFLVSFAPTPNLTGQGLGGKTLLPGVYRFSDSAQLTGALPRAGNSSAVTINGITGPTCCNVLWQGGSAATLGIDTGARGNFLTLSRITLTTRANIADGGRVPAWNGAVTLGSNTIPNAGGDGFAAPAEAPEPGTLLLLGAGVFGLILLGRRSRSRAEIAHT